MGSIKKPKFLHWLPQDKWDHLIVGIMPGMIGFVAGMIVFEKQFNPNLDMALMVVLSFIVAAVLGLFVGAIKEKIDEMDPKKVFDNWDVVATMVGALVGAAFCFIVYLLLG